MCSSCERKRKADKGSVPVANSSYYMTNRPLKIAAIGTMIVAGMILLLNILNAKQSGPSATLDTDVELVNKLIWMLTSLDTA